MKYNAQNEDRIYNWAKNMEQTSRICQKSYQFEFFQKKKAIPSFLKIE